MCEPTIPAKMALTKLNQLFERNELPQINEHDLTYCSWPELFSSSCGPFHGIGGQAFTTFRMEAWVYGDYAVIFCCEKVVKIGYFRIQAEYR